MPSFEVSFERIEASAIQADVEALAKMAQFTFADTFTHYQESDLNDYLTRSLSPQALGKELKDSNNHFYFVIKNGQRCGFLKCIFPSTVYLEHADLKCEHPFLLERFYFLPEFCGQGLASIALEFVHALAKHHLKADYIYLSVWEKNYRAQRFYQKHGFRTLGSFDYPVGTVIDKEFLLGKSL